MYQDMMMIGDRARQGYSFLTLFTAVLLGRPLREMNTLVGVWVPRDEDDLPENALLWEFYVGPMAQFYDGGNLIEELAAHPWFHSLMPARGEASQNMRLLAFLIPEEHWGDVESFFEHGPLGVSEAYIETLLSVDPTLEGAIRRSIQYTRAKNAAESDEDFSDEEIEAIQEAVQGIIGEGRPRGSKVTH